MAAYMEQLQDALAAAETAMCDDSDRWEALGTGQNTEEAEESGRLAGVVDGLEQALHLVRARGAGTIAGDLVAGAAIDAVALMGTGVIVELDVHGVPSPEFAHLRERFPDARMVNGSEALARGRRLDVARHGASRVSVHEHVPAPAGATRLPRVATTG